MIWTGIVRALWKPVAAILALLGIYAAGKRHARQRAKSDGLQDYIETRKKADEADIVDSPDLARSWLHERGKQ
jgi:hypothetical protein